MGLAACCMLASCAPSAPPSGPPLVFLGEAVIATDAGSPDDPQVGGLSSLVRVDGDTYYAISDDRGRRGPARFYVLRIDLANDRLDAEGATILEWRELLDANGDPLTPSSFDHEGMAPLNGHLFVASEGDVSLGIPPYVAVFGADGRRMEPLALPPGFIPDEEHTVGIRNNQAFESLTLAPGDRFLFTATEGPLVQDGPAPTPDAGGVSRILRFDRERGGFDAQFAYELEPVHTTSPEADGLEVNGLVELLALSDTHLLALERSFVAGADPMHAINVFEVCLDGATDVAQIDGLTADDAAVTPARKRLIANLADLVPRIDNVEGITFGPALASGERTLLFVSDDNLAPQRQVTQILAFAVSPDAFTGCGG